MPKVDSLKMAGETDKPLAILTTKEEAQMTSVRDENRRHNHRCSTNYVGVVMNNSILLDEVDRTLEKYNLIKASQEEITDLNSPVNISEIEPVDKTFQSKAGLDSYNRQVSTFKKERILI